MRKQETCTTCGGRGRAYSAQVAQVDVCRPCRGTGLVWQQRRKHDPAKAVERDRYMAGIRRLFPHARLREIDFMLWNMTAWPVCGNTQALAQLATVRIACGPDSKRGWWRKVLRLERDMDIRMGLALRAITREQP